MYAQGQTDVAPTPDLAPGVHINCTCAAFVLDGEHG
jgi:hypothetical protein